MWKNWKYMLLALVMSVFSWFLVNGQETVETVVDMSVIMSNPPKGLMVESGLVDTIRVRLRGPKGLLRTLSGKQLVYDVDARDFHVGENVVEVDVDRIPVPSAFTIVEIMPNRLSLQVDRIAVKTIPVEVDWIGELDSYYEFDGVSVEPSEVEIRGPETQLRKIIKARITVRENFPRDVPKVWIEHSGLNLPDEIEPDPAQVRIAIKFKPKTKEIWVKIPLNVVAPKSLAVTPRQDYVRLLIDGPLLWYRDNTFRKDISAFLDVPKDIGPGEYDMEYKVVVPDGVKVEKLNPETVGVTIERK